MSTGQFFPRLRLGRPFESRLFVNKKAPPDGGWFYSICLSAHSPTDCVRKGRDSPTGKGSSESIDCGWTADLFLPDCGLKNGKYIQYSSIFQALSGRKSLVASSCRWIPSFPKMPPDSFSPGCAWVALSNPASSLTKKRPRMGAGFITFAFPPTVLRTAFGKAGILPRAKNCPPDSFSPGCAWVALSNPISAPKSSTPAGVLLFWRREWDSNPRWVAPSPVFKTGTLNRSDISPDTEKPPKRR